MRPARFLRRAFTPRPDASGRFPAPPIFPPEAPHNAGMDSGHKFIGQIIPGLRAIEFFDAGLAHAMRERAPGVFLFITGNGPPMSMAVFYLFAVGAD